MKNVIKFLEDREFIDQKTSNELEKITAAPISLYLGIDPTAGSLHLGHLVGLIALMHFQRFGHKPILLVGGATALIGDPSGKDKERPLLTEDLVRDNVSSLKKVLEKFLDFTHPTAAPIIVNNYDWFTEMNAVEFLRDIGKQFRIGQMMGKESVRARLQSEEGMSFTEFSYQLLQGYDFYHLFKEHKAQLQIGGSDQYGNITAGIEYIRRVEGKPAYGVTFPLLTRSDGKKFGKSEKGAIWLTEELCSPFEFYQYLYRTPDSDIIRMMKMLTLMETEEIRKIERDMKSDSYQPNSAQKRFAEEVTTLVHGREGLKKALKTTEVVSPGGRELNVDDLEQIAKNMPNIELGKADVLGLSYVDLAVKSSLLASKGEARRLIKNNGAYLNGEKVVDPALIIDEKDILKGSFIIMSSGKKKTLLIKIV